MNNYPGAVLHRRPPETSGLLLPAQRGPGPPRDQPLRAGLHPARDRPGAAGRVQRPVDRSTTTTAVRPVHAGVRRHRALADHGRGRHDVREGQRARTTPSRSMTTTWRSTRRSTLTSDDKVRHDLATGSSSGGRPSSRAQSCVLQKNTLVSPLHDTIKQEPPDGYDVCGYFFKPDQHTGDMAAMIDAAAEDRRARVPARHTGGRQRLPRVRQQHRGVTPKSVDGADASGRARCGSRWTRA